MTAYKDCRSAHLGACAAASFCAIFNILVHERRPADCRAIKCSRQGSWLDAVSTSMPIVILSAGREPQLSRKRDQALIAAGYNVVSANNSPEIINKLFNGDFDAVILCNSIPNEERRRLSSIIKSYSPSTPVILLAEMQGRKYDYGTVTTDATPEQIVATVHATFTKPKASSA